jgi:hypothetical protein
MATTVTIEIAAEDEALVRRLLALREELGQLALTAPDGAVFDACESAVLLKGRELQTQLLAEAVARRIVAAEKKGRPSASVPVAAPKKTADQKHASS